MKKSNKSLSNTKFSDKLIYDWFQAKIDMENEMDHIKSEIISHSKFNITHLFQHLDKRRNRAISAEDIQTFFKNVGLKVSSQEIQSILKYFSQQKTIDFNHFFIRLVPLTARPVSIDDSPIEDLLSKLFFSIIEHSESVSKAQLNLSTIESLNMELICKDRQQFTIQDLQCLFKKYGGWTINHQNSSAVFGNKLSLNRQDLCFMIGIQFQKQKQKDLTLNRSGSKGTEETVDETIKPRNEGAYHRTFSNSFFENEVNFFVDHEMTQYEREMLYE